MANERLSLDPRTSEARAMQFFVLRVASNKEDRVKDALERKVKIEGLETHVGRILVPTERVRTQKQGVRRESDRKLYPGYVFVELELDKEGRIPEKVWFTIKETEGVGDFIGSNGKPSAMSVKDQERMIQEAEKPEETVSPAESFKKGGQDQGDQRSVRELRRRSRRSARRTGQGAHRHDDL